jgi:hypothetical protein
MGRSIVDGVIMAIAMALATINASLALALALLLPNGDNKGLKIVGEKQRKYLASGYRGQWLVQH